MQRADHSDVTVGCEYQAQAVFASARRSGEKSQFWLFSKTIDLTAFLGSAVISILLLAAGWQFGFLHGESPDWTWISAVLLIDVAHVWSTSFRVYFDTAEFKRRFWLYSLVPVFGYALGVALYSEGELVFWKSLAVVAVFHFVRQQYGWVNLYRRKLGETEVPSVTFRKSRLRTPSAKNRSVRPSSS